jgi:hypothetical protein
MRERRAAMKDRNTPPMRDAKGAFLALGQAWKASALTRDGNGRPFRWRDPDRLIHATVEWPLDPGDPASIGATRCGLYDIPPGESWTGRDELTCKVCKDSEDTEEKGARTRDPESEESESEA